jgi:Skp family chaperone for outer membrane proteins
MQKAAALLVMLVASVPALAAETRIGVVDFAKIYSTSETSRKDRAELDKLMADKQAAVDAEKARVARMQSELESARPKLDPSARARREAEVDVQAAALRKLFEEAEKAVTSRERELSGRVITDAKQLAPGIAKQHGLALVLGATEAILFAAPSVVQVDLTGEVAQALDKLRPTKASSLLRHAE